MDCDMLDVRPVMPGIGHKGRGVHDFGVMPGVAVHDLLGNDRNEGGSQGEDAGNGQSFIVAGKNLFQPDLTDSETGDQQNRAQQPYRM